MLSVFHREFTPDETFRGVGRITGHRPIVLRYRSHFDQYYRNSLPASFVVRHLREAGARLTERASRELDTDEVKWLRSLVEFGKFSTYHRESNWSSQKRHDVIARALRSALVRRNVEGETVAGYDLTLSDLVTAYGAASS
jgi:hypothetical protein